jgi:hypothetical protein
MNSIFDDSLSIAQGLRKCEVYFCVPVMSIAFEVLRIFFHFCVELLILISEVLLVFHALTQCHAMGGSADTFSHASLISNLVSHVKIENQPTW